MDIIKKVNKIIRKKYLKFKNHRQNKEAEYHSKLWDKKLKGL